jgi:hypothetical protein
MSTVLALAVACGFAWSIVLFFAAVFIREREQDAGFGWALAGAVVFLVVYADRLPGVSGARSAVSLLPGVSVAHEHFASPVVALWLLLVVYLFRIAVFYQLFLKDGRTVDEDGDEDIVNDVVAPALSYVCFAICLVALLVPAYGLGVLPTLLLIAVLVALHYWPLLQILEEYLRNLRAILVVGWSRARRLARRMVLEGVVWIMRAESPRYRGRRDLSAWARERLEALRREDELARISDGEIIRKAARHSSRRSRHRAKRKVAS